MSTTAEQLLVRVDGTTEQLRRELRRGDQAVSRTTRTMERQLGRVDRSFQRLNRAAGNATRVLATFGVTLGVRQFQRFTREAISAAAGLQDVADIAGIGVERSQELTKAFSDLGRVSESVSAGAFRRFNRRLGLARDGAGQAVDAFDALGISLTQTTEDALERSLEQLAAIEDPARRAAMASRLFGEDAGPQLAAVLGRGTAAINQQIARIREQGRVMDADGVAAAVRMDDQMSELADTLRTNLQRAVIENTEAFDEMIVVLNDPAFTDGLEFLVEIFADLGREVAESTAQFGRLMNMLRGDFSGLGDFAGSLVEGSIPGRVFGMGGISVRDTIGLPAPDTQAGTQRPERIPRSGITGVMGRTGGGTAGAEESEPGTPFDLGRVGNEQLRELEIQLGFQEELTDAIRMGEDALRDVTQQHERIRQVMDLRQDLEREILDAAEDRDQLTLDELDHVQQVTDAFAERFAVFQELEAEYERITEQQQRADEFNRQLAASMTSGFEDAIIRGNQFRDVLDGILQDMARIILRQQILQPLTDSLGSSFPNLFGNADGNAFSGGSVVPFASGGVVGGPTLFGMSGGKTGLMGEAGPEAIMPLSRGAGGKLGVEAQVSPVAVSMPVRIENYGSDDVETRREQSDDGIEELVITIAARDVQTGGRLGKAINKVTGTTRRGVQR